MCVRRRFTVIGAWAVLVTALVTAARVFGTPTDNDVSLPGADAQFVRDLTASPEAPLTSGTVILVAPDELADEAHAGVPAATAESLRRAGHVTTVRPPSTLDGSLSGDGRTGWFAVGLDVRRAELGEPVARAVVDAARPAADDGLRVLPAGAFAQAIDGSSSTGAESFGLALTAFVLFLALGGLVGAVLPPGGARDAGGGGPRREPDFDAGAGVDPGAHGRARRRHRLLAVPAEPVPVAGAVRPRGAGGGRTRGRRLRHGGGLRGRHGRGLARGTGADRGAAAGDARLDVRDRGPVRRARDPHPAARADLPGRATTRPRRRAARPTDPPRRRAARPTDPPRRSFGTSGRASATPRRPFGTSARSGRPTGRPRRSFATTRRQPRRGPVGAFRRSGDAPTRAGRRGRGRGAGPARGAGGGPAPRPGGRRVLAAVRQADDAVAAAFGPGAGTPLVVLAELPTPVTDPRDPGLSSLVAAVRDQPGVAVTGPPTPSGDGRVVTVRVIPSTSGGDPATADLVHRLRDRSVPGPTLHVGGSVAARVDLADRVADKHPLVIGVVLLLSIAVLLVAFRAPLLALKAAVMDLISIGAAYGVLTAVFTWGWGVQWIGLSGPVSIPGFVPLMLFALLFGLSMDYEVFLLGDVRRRRHETGDNLRSVREGLVGTGGVITAAAAIMVGVFLAFVPDHDPTIKMFGVGMAVAIAVDTTVVRCLLVPATMAVLGDLTWWTPRRRRTG